MYTKSTLERFEKMGPRGGLPSLIFALALGGTALTAATWSVTTFSDQPWTAGLLQGAAMLTSALAMVFGMVGIRLLTDRRYPPVEDVFPSLSRNDFVSAVHREARPLCVCTRCLIHLPGQFSTGACPRCSSAVEYYEITNDGDADMVVMSLG